MPALEEMLMIEPPPACCIDGGADLDADAACR